MIILILIQYKVQLESMSNKVGKSEIVTFNDPVSQILSLEGKLTLIATTSQIYSEKRTFLRAIRCINIQGKT